MKAAIADLAVDEEVEAVVVITKVVMAKRPSMTEATLVAMVNADDRPRTAATTMVVSTREVRANARGVEVQVVPAITTTTTMVVRTTAATTMVVSTREARASAEAVAAVVVVVAVVAAVMELLSTRIVVGVATWEVAVDVATWKVAVEVASIRASIRTSIRTSSESTSL